jgi:triosephosphate isomerase (TIM)
MRRKIIAGNWKMNKTIPEALELAGGIAENVDNKTKAAVLVCPPFTALSEAAKILKNSPVLLGAQNMYFKESGAYTGEIAPSMLLTIGVSHVILGHSERREYFSESDRMVNDKVRLALQSGLIPIVCVGEKLEDREKGQTEEVVGAQIDGSLDGLTPDEAGKTIVAYEPIWAIGTGKTATPEMAQEVHAFIRGRLKNKFGAVADTMPILYGGSVKGDNAAGLLNQADIDGALVGGASLKADEFVKIINAV